MKPAVFTLAMLLAAFAVKAQPVVTVQPTNQTVFVGTCTAFNVSVSDTGPFSYQWLFNGTNLPPNGIYIITTVAGNGTNGFSGDNGVATNAELNYPYGVGVDSSGNLFIADTYNFRIRKVDTNGIITTVAGNGLYRFSGDGGAATNATLWSPSGVVVDVNGNLFIADGENQRVRKVNTHGIITTVAGNGTNGYSGDGRIATNAELYLPTAVALDASGNLFIDDLANACIRKVTINGIISTVAGDGYASFSGDGEAAIYANLNYPLGIAVDANDNLFIADANNFRIRKVNTNGIITTFAGNGTYGYSGDGGAATNADLCNPNSVAVDANGNLFISDVPTDRIRKVDTNGIITTIAGNGSYGFSGDGGVATNAALKNPNGVAVDARGNLFIADEVNQRIRKLTSSPYSPSLILNTVSKTNAGDYSVIISGSSGSVTSSIVTLTVVSSPLISRTVLNSNASLTLNCLTTPNASSRVLVATNLTPPVVWRPIYTNVPGASGAWQFTDTNISTSIERFYRTSTP